MTQSPETVLDAEIAPVLLTNLATSIYFPNPRALSETYEQGLGLTASEFQTVKNLNPSSRLFLYKQEDDAMVCRLDLSALADALRVFSGNKKSVALFDALSQQQKGHPHSCIDAFLEQSR